MATKFKMPETVSEADTLIREIGKFQREEEDVNLKIAELEGELKGRIEQLDEAIMERLAALYGFFIKNKKELTEEGKIKVVMLSSGDMEILLTPPSVNIKKEELVIEVLKRMGLRRFIRTKEEVNKEAVLLEPESVSDIEGIKISQKERFLVRPQVTGKSAIEDTKKLKKLLP